MAQWIRRSIGAVFASIVLTGCAHTQRPEITDITLETAMADVALGLNKIYAERQGHDKSGLVPSEITVTFNVGAKGQDSSKLYIEAGAKAGAVSIAKAGGETGGSLEVSRGNTITIKFSSVLYAGKDTLVASKSADEIKKLLESLGGILVR